MNRIVAKTDLQMGALKNVMTTKRPVIDKNGAQVGAFSMDIALVPVDAVEGPNGEKPKHPMWTFNVNGIAGDVQFMIVMTTMGADERDGMEIVATELGKLLHGLSHQIEAATENAGVVVKGNES